MTEQEIIEHIYDTIMNGELDENELYPEVLVKVQRIKKLKRILGESGRQKPYYEGRQNNE